MSPTFTTDLQALISTFLDQHPEIDLFDALGSLGIITMDIIVQSVPPPEQSHVFETFQKKLTHTFPHVQQLHSKASN